MTPFTPLTDAEWQSVESLFVTPLKRGRGKPHAPWRAVVNSVLFALFAGGKWGAIPKNLADFASKSAAHRWFLEWEKTGLLEELLTRVGASRSSLPPLFRRNRGKKPPPQPPLDVGTEPFSH